MLAKRFIQLCALAIAVYLPFPRPAFGVSPGDILVADRPTHSIFVVNAVTGAQTTLTAGGLLSAPVAVAVAANGDIFVVDGDRFGSGSKIIKVDPALGTQSLVASGGNLLDPCDIAIESDGKLLIADFSAPTGLGGILRVDPTTGSQSILLNNEVFGRQPFAVAIEASGNAVFTGYGGGLYRLDIGSGIVTVLTPIGGYGVRVEASGNFVLLAVEGDTPPYKFTVARVDAVTGANTVVSSGGLLLYPHSIALESDGDIDVAGGDAIIRVDPVTGAQQPVSSGGSFQDLQGLTILKDTSTSVGRETWGRLKVRYR